MSKKNAQKLKEREKRVKEKLQRRREAIRKKAKADRMEALAQREAQKIDNRVNGRTIVNRSPDDQHALLTRNLEILKALEDQQKFLEQERLKTPSVNQQHERARGIKQSADVCFIPNPITNEPLVAQAEVAKETDLSDTPSPIEQYNQNAKQVAEILETTAMDPAATRLAEKLESLSRKRNMGLKK
jgi:hypothetical protein